MYDLGIGTQNTSWQDSKTYTKGIFAFKDYQIREKYNGVGVRVNITGQTKEGLIEIDVADIDYIEFTLFSSVPSLNPDIINISIILE